MAHAKKTGFKAANEFEQASLTNCLEKLSAQQHLLMLARSALPGDIAPRALHCVLSGTRLLVYVENANWASQIRFFQEVILNKIQSGGQQKIDKLQVRIVDASTPAANRRKPKLPSEDTVRLLQNCVSPSVGEDLASSLGRLADTLAKRLNQSEAIGCVSADRMSGRPNE